MANYKFPADFKFRLSQYGGTVQISQRCQLSAMLVLGRPAKGQQLCPGFMRVLGRPAKGQQWCAGSTFILGPRLKDFRFGFYECHIKCCQPLLTIILKAVLWSSLWFGQFLIINFSYGLINFYYSLLNSKDKTQIVFIFFIYSSLSILVLFQLSVSIYAKEQAVKTTRFTRSFAVVQRNEHSIDEAQ